MEDDRVKVLSRQSNAAVVRMPGRSFPGVVLQGDSLRIHGWCSKHFELA